jgi:hypothetical protein
MWLEEMAWLWVPIASGLGLWVVWSAITLKAEVRELRQRVERLETDIGTHNNEEQKVLST